MTALEADGGLFTLANSPEFRDDPYVFYRMLRESTPRLRTDFGLWFLTTHADAAAVLRDPRNSSDEHHSNLYEQFLEQAKTEGRESTIDSFQTMLFMDPPDHTRLRGLVQMAFTPRMVVDLEPRIRALSKRYLDAAIGPGEMDLVNDYAVPLPMHVIAGLLGIHT